MLDSPKRPANSPAVPAQDNPLVDDRLIDFLLYEVIDVESLCDNPFFADHSRETFELYLNGVRRFARKELFATYKAMDEAPPTFVDGKVHTHPSLPALYQTMVELGTLGPSWATEVGGQQLPTVVQSLGSAYLMAGNLSAYGYVGLTEGAAGLIQTFGDDALKVRFVPKMLSGQYNGTMALTEPHAGSNLGALKTTATPTDDGHYLVKGSKIFISGADNTVVDNTINLTLARIAGAPDGTKGISLFAIPRLRSQDGKLVSNDVAVSGMIHKIGWKGLPSLAIEFGDENDCRGWLVGEPHQGLRYMFQMMNEARIMVGMNGVATASVAYHEAKNYALDRRQGRKLGSVEPEQVPIVEHADVRRMLLRQKAIVEGAFGLLAIVSHWSDIAKHGPESQRERAHLLVDLLTPVAKTFPAEKGFEANALSVQVHGGYGYTSEYLPESFMRDQKLNTLHEGTTGIQSLDLLGRKVVQKGGAGLAAFVEEVAATVTQARQSSVDSHWCDAVQGATDTVASLTMELAKRGMAGDTLGMIGHSWDYMDLFSTTTIGWVWLKMAAHAKQGLETRSEAEQAHRHGLLSAAQYWILTELPRVQQLAQLCASNEDSYLKVEPAWL